MAKELYIVDDDGESISVIETPMEDDKALCKIELSEKAAKAHDLIVQIHRAFDVVDSSFYRLFDEIARAAYAAAQKKTS